MVLSLWPRLRHVSDDDTKELTNGCHCYCCHYGFVVRLVELFTLWKSLLSEIIITGGRGGGGVHRVYELKTADIWRQTNNGIFLYKHQNGGRISTSFI